MQIYDDYIVAIQRIHASKIKDTINICEDMCRFIMQEIINFEGKYCDDTSKLA